MVAALLFENVLLDGQQLGIWFVHRREFQVLI
jgi:hypothetical protein